MATTKKKKQVAKKRVVKTIKKSGAGKYQLTVHFNDTDYISAGASVVEAIKNISFPVTMFKTKIMMYLSYGKQSSEQMIFPIQMRRMKMNKTAQQIWAKRLEMKLR